jgi:hypothetical protein
MPEYFTTIANIPVPFILPMRGRQDKLNIIGQVKVKTKVFVDPTNVVRFCAPFGKATCFVDTPFLMAQSIAENLKLKRVRVEIRFPVVLDRTTVELEDVVYAQVPCGYNGEVDGIESTGASIQVQVPIQVQYVHPVVGSLTFVVMDPAKGLTFEDLVDHLQRYAKMTFYPLASTENIQKLPDALGKCLTPREILSEVSDASIGKGLWKRGMLLLEHPDVYSMYQFSYRMKWGGEGRGR